MTFDINFWWSLSSLLIIIFYAILVFKNIDPLIATAVCVILGFIFNKSSPLDIGMSFESALSSFLALIGFIIMLGRGLGEILAYTGVSQTLVYKIIYTIGVNTKNKVKVGIIISTLIIVGMLGTLAGGLSILAPVFRPIASSVGITRPALAVLMQASAEEALILGPFTPVMMTLMQIFNLNYSNILLQIAIPISLVTILISWIVASVFQKKYRFELYESIEIASFIPNKKQKLATILFVFIFTLCVIYGLIAHAKTSYVIFVMLFLSLLIGLISGVSLTKIFELLITGMKKNFNLFIIFILLDPFLNLIKNAGGFNSFTKLIAPLLSIGSGKLLAIIIGLTGAFGMPAASVAVIKLLSQMFNPIAIKMQLSFTIVAFSIVIATRITNFVYPGANMFAAMGLAESKNIKAMIINGLIVASIQIIFLIIYSTCFA